MSELFDAVTSRLKAIFTAHAALELEAELLNRHVERKAALLKRASELEQQGLADLAAELRQHTNEVTIRKHTEAAQIAGSQRLPAPNNTSNEKDPTFRDAKPEGQTPATRKKSP